jgi:methyltransferase OMS1
MRVVPRHAPPRLAPSAPWWAYWRHVAPRDDAAPRAASAAPPPPPPGPSNAGGGAVEAAAAARPSPASARELPGLNAGGLWNFVRLFTGSSAPSSAPATPPASGGAEAGAEPAAEPAAGPRTPQPQAQGTGASHTAAGTSGQGRAGAAAAAAAAAHAHPQRGGACEQCAASSSHAPPRLLGRFAPGQFDTVVDTFGLCSHADPVQVSGCAKGCGGLRTAPGPCHGQPSCGRGVNAARSLPGP